MTTPAAHQTFRVAYFVMRYPLLTQTFIDREMRGLIEHGVTIEVHPIWDWGNREAVAPNGPEIFRPRFVRILWSAAVEAVAYPGLVWRGVRALFRSRPGFAEGWFMTIWGGIVALGLARDFRARASGGDRVHLLHGAWATAPATAAQALSRLLDLPFSFGAHAYDLYRHGGDPLLPLKLQRARFVHTTTQANVEYLASRFPDRRADIVLARRGLTELPPLQEDRTGSRKVLRLLSVGRLVPKKGQHFQLAAVAELRRRDFPVRLRIIGEGPERASLEEMIRAQNLASAVELCGAQTPEEVQRAYGDTDIFLHTGIVDSEGDRDGLPNVVPEAMACGVCVIGSPGGGAAEAIENEATGLVVDPADPVALADAMVRISTDATLRDRLRRNAHRWVGENFLVPANTAILAAAMRAQAASGR